MIELAIIATITAHVLFFTWILRSGRKPKPPIDGTRIKITPEIVSKAVAIQKQED